MSITGKQVPQFLQGLVTNDTRSLETAGAPPVYAALLTHKGKLQYDAFVYRQEDDNFLLEVDASMKDELAAWLARYKLRKAITIKDASSEYSAWVHFGQEAKSGSPPAAAWHTDPRLPGLGHRAILPKDQQPSISGSELSDESAYRHWRYTHGVAEGSRELGAGRYAPLDFNLDVLHGVSYDKGCYIGQERTSFSHFRGVIRSRAMPARMELAAGTPAADLDADLDVLAADSDEVLGSVRGGVTNPEEPGHGMALLMLRLKAGLAAESPGARPLRVRGLPHVGLRPFRPAWWPAEWGREEDAAAAQAG